MTSSFFPTLVSIVSSVVGSSPKVRSYACTITDVTKVTGFKYNHITHCRRSSVTYIHICTSVLYSLVLFSIPSYNGSIR